MHEMSAPMIKFSEANLRNLVYEPIEQFVHGGNDSHTDEQFKRLAEDGMFGAYLGPCVDFVTGLALDLAQSKQAQEQLTDEVIERAVSIAHMASELVARPMAEAGLFLIAYENRVIGLSDVPLFVKTALLDSEYMRPVASAPFTDAARVIGGVARKLEGLVRKDESLDIVQRSHSLLAIAGTSNVEEVARPLLNTLGLPYIHGHHLVLKTDSDDSSVGFTDSALDLIHAASADTKGCPAARVTTKLGQTLLSARWDEIAEVLLANDFTVQKAQMRF